MLAITVVHPAKTVGCDEMPSSSHSCGAKNELFSSNRHYSTVALVLPISTVVSGVL